MISSRDVINECLYKTILLNFNLSLLLNSVTYLVVSLQNLLVGGRACNSEMLKIMTESQFARFVHSAVPVLFRCVKLYLSALSLTPLLAVV